MPWKNGNPPLYHVWRSMISRCYDKKGKQFRDYGGRGIKVCPQWRHDYKQWYADMPPRPPGTSIDRFPDNNGDYKPGNVRWATRSQQQLNRRNTKILTIEGKRYYAIRLAKKYKLKWDTVVERAEAGLPFNEIISPQRRFNLEGFKLGAAISAAKRNLRTHCKNGHEYTEETTRWTTNGKYTWRDCRVCAREKMRRKYATGSY